jgi:hypothetical protein
MNTYQYIDHTLGSYFAVSNGEPENEAMAMLKKHLAENPALANNLRSELESALNDPSFSWRDALERNDVVVMDSEVEARSYALTLLSPSH